MMIISQRIAAAVLLCTVAIFVTNGSIFLLSSNHNTSNIAYAQQSNKEGGRRVTFLTDDNVSIAGTYYAPSSGGE